MQRNPPVFCGDPKSTQDTGSSKLHHFDPPPTAVALAGARRACSPPTFPHSLKSGRYASPVEFLFLSFLSRLVIPFIHRRPIIFEVGYSSFFLLQKRDYVSLCFLRQPRQQAAPSACSGLSDIFPPLVSCVVFVKSYHR